MIKLEAKMLTRRDDPVGHFTPGPGSKYEFMDWPEPGTAKPRLKESERDDSHSGSDGDGVREGLVTMILKTTGWIYWFWIRILYPVEGRRTQRTHPLHRLHRLMFLLLPKIGRPCQVPRNRCQRNQLHLRFRK